MIPSLKHIPTGLYMPIATVLFHLLHKKGVQFVSMPARGRNTNWIYRSWEDIIVSGDFVEVQIITEDDWYARDKAYRFLLQERGRFTRKEKRMFEDAFFPPNLEKVSKDQYYEYMHAHKVSDDGYLTKLDDNETGTDTYQSEIT